MLKALTFVVFGSSAICGCAFQPEDESAAEEPTGQVEQAILADITCASSSNTDRVTDYGCDLAGGESCSYTTADGSYGNDYGSGEDCQPYMNFNTWTGYDGPQYPVPVRYWAQFVDYPDNPTDCNKAYLDLAAYYYDENGGQFHMVSTRQNHGVWIGSPLNVCLIGTPHIDYTMTCVSGKCKKVQIVTARAWYTGWPAASHKRVRLGIYRTD